jgi:ATP-dependent helicase/nuclease subunit A
LKKWEVCKVSGKKSKWTPDQQKAISERGHDVLVTASAGTGKTAVLSGRCVDIVADNAACPDVRNLLVLTFTEAAAAEMKTRIGEALKDRYIANRDDHLRRQLLLLDAADISTIHSFCKRLISEHFYRVGIDPNFRIIDEDEQNLIKAEIRDEIVLEAYEDALLSPALASLLNGRNVSGSASFLNIIIAIHNYLDSVVSRPDWYASAEDLYSSNPLSGQFGQKQRDILLSKLNVCLARLHHTHKLDKHLAGGHWQSQIANDFVAPIQWCVEQIQRGDIDAAATMIQGFAKPRWINRPKGMSEEIAAPVKEPANKALDTFQSLSQMAIINPQYLDIVAASASGQTKVLVELVKRFDHRYHRLKSQLNCLDFADLEHLALELLTIPDADGNASPSPIAMQLRERFKYIFVDEYQDINAVQQAILDRLSRADNVFVVGDIKQSIYAFRQAQPEILLRRLENASYKPTVPTQDLRVDLGDNFRSRGGILDFVNAVFSRIMTASFAGIDYDYTAMLHPRADYKPLEETTSLRPVPPLIEMHLLDTGADTDTSDDQAEDNQSLSSLSPTQLQAGLIGRRIRQMVGSAEFKIFDKATDSYRDVEYRDIVILMRSPANKAGDYIRILRLMGVPVSSQGSSGYFETTEITDCICLLCVLENPQRDIELAAVLRSPFFNISDTELAEIRMSGNSDSNFYQAVLSYSQSGAEEVLRNKLAAILAQLDSWRTMARRGSIADLIWHILRKTRYLSFVSALPGAKQRRANLLKLHQRAIQFEGFVTSQKTVSLTRFVEFIEKLLEQGQDWAPAEPDSAAQNAVRIMSVHKSKGLEFPVVFLAELNTKFNTQDQFGQCLIDAQDTLGLEIIEPNTKSRLATIGHQVISETKKAISLAEEMRILYVAMTRARERLILTASATGKHCRSVLHKGVILDEPAVPDWLLADCQRPLDWILYGLAKRRILLDAFGVEDKNALDDKLFSLDICDSDKIADLAAEIEALRGKGKSRNLQIDLPAAKLPAEVQRMFAQIKSSLGWRYPFADISKLQAKTSVSQLTHRSDEFARSFSEYAEVLAQSPHLSLTADISSNYSQLIGTATHLVMQRLDFTTVTPESVRQTIEKLVACNAITKEIADKINVKSITAFFDSELGALVKDPASIIYREWPFSFGLPAKHFIKYGTAPDCDENVIVQGIIDLLIQTTNGLIVIDFKTDNITGAQSQTRAAVYAPQMNLYALAAKTVLKMPVKAKFVYFLTPAKCAEI